MQSKRFNDGSLEAFRWADVALSTATSRRKTARGGLDTKTRHVQGLDPERMTEAVADAISDSNSAGRIGLEKIPQAERVINVETLNVPCRSHQHDSGLSTFVKGGQVASRGIIIARKIGEKEGLNPGVVYKSGCHDQKDNSHKSGDDVADLRADHSPKSWLATAAVGFEACRSAGDGHLSQNFRFGIPAGVPQQVRQRKLRVLPAS